MKLKIIDKKAFVVMIIGMAFLGFGMYGLTQTTPEMFKQKVVPLDAFGGISLGFAFFILVLMMVGNSRNIGDGERPKLESEKQ